MTGLTEPQRKVLADIEHWAKRTQSGYINAAFIGRRRTVDTLVKRGVVERSERGTLGAMHTVLRPIEHDADTDH